MGEESPKTREKKKKCQKRKKKTTRHRKLAPVQQLKLTLIAERRQQARGIPETNMDSGDIIRAINELKNDIKGHNDSQK